MMKATDTILGMALAVTLALAGCGKKKSDSGPVPGGEGPPRASDGPRPETAPPPPPTSLVTTDAPGPAPTPAAEFSTKLLASPFAPAEPALSETYARALIAFQIGDYARAVTELEDLAKTPELTAEQRRAVTNLLAQAVELAPTAAVDPGAPPLSTPSTGAVMDTPEVPFASANEAVKRSYARIRAACKIGDYGTAIAELQDLATTPDLTVLQQQTVQTLLSDLQRITPPRTEPPPGQPAQR
jgi:hypothetical protein